MALTVGTVSYIKVNKPPSGSSDYCFFGLVPVGGTQAELFILWSSPPPITAAQWVVNNATLLMLREAFTNKTPVTVFTQGNSAIVGYLQVGQS